VMRFVERCDLLLTGAQELAELLGESNDARMLAEHAAARGPREIVVRASASAGALSANGPWVEIDVRRHTALDPIGAGDAFNAGYIAVRLNGGTIEDALQAGARCGRAVTTTVSDTSAFPRGLE
jgi:2-dehydro-3-deoxygluconokinase